jgi:hypothetical protein
VIRLAVVYVSDGCVVGMSAEGEPSADLIAQISQEIYSSHVLHVAIKQLHLVDFEVGTP